MNKVVLKDEKLDRKEELWCLIGGRLKADRHKERTTRIWYYAAAAVVAMALAFTGLESRRSCSSGNGSEAVSLPCGSTADLNAHSTLTYNRIGYKFERKVALAGTATFEVTKGRKFTVQTKQGNITVLGTRFLVAEAPQDSALHIECYDGTVKVENHAGAEAVLHAGEQADCSPRGVKTAEILPEFITYDSAPLGDVVSELEKIYGIEVAGLEKHHDMTFSGLMPTGNKEDALSIVFGSCGIEYSEDGGMITLK